MREIQRYLSWQPLFGSGARIGYTEALGLSMEEVDELLEFIAEQRKAEWKAFSKK